MQSLILLASLVSELAGGVKMTPHLVLNVTKNTLVLYGLMELTGLDLMRIVMIRQWLETKAIFWGLRAKTELSSSVPSGGRF